MSGFTISSDISDEDVPAVVGVRRAVSEHTPDLDNLRRALQTMRAA